MNEVILDVNEVILNVNEVILEKLGQERKKNNDFNGHLVFN